MDPLILALRGVHDAAGESGGAISGKGRVHEVECLGRHLRPVTNGGGLVRIGAIEEFEERVLEQTLRHQVDGSMIVIENGLER